MTGRFKRTIGALVMVLVGYSAYAVLAVPMLEPSIELAASSHSASTHPHATPKSRGFESLFAEGSWELDRPKILETDRGTLIFDDYRALPDSRLQLNRCTLILRTSQDDRENSRPIVLRATEGAILFFDGELNIPRGEFGRLIGGELSGVVTIHSPPTPGADDGLEITTRDIRIEERRIWTPSNVTFRYGPNAGSGGDLSITMHPPAKAKPASGAGSNLGRLKSFELVRVDKIELQLPADSLSDSPLAPRVASPSTGSQTTPVEIRCRGSLEFDFDESQLTLNDHVDVIRHHVDGPSDQLNCQELRVHFHQPSTPGEAGSGTSIKFAPSKLVAIGFPVILRADSYGAFAQGEQLEYDFAAQRISMRDREAVVMGNENYELKAKWLWYELRDGKQLGSMRAGGPGRVTGRLGKDQQPFEAAWQSEVVLQPSEGGDVLSLLGGAHISVEQAGELFADELHVYLAELPTADGAARPAITADRMKALGNVRFDSPRIAGTIHDVQIWFTQPPDRDLSDRPATGATAGSSLLANRNPASSTGQVQKLVVQAERLNAEIQLGDNPQLLQLGAQGKVHCEEQAAPEIPSGMSLDCHVFQVLDGATENPIATVEGSEGSPARVMAQGAELVGALIEIHQGSNRAFIKGPGQMTLPRPETPQAPWFVQWQHGMRFDGRQATFDGGAVAQGVQAMRAGEQVRFHATGDSLNVTLTRSVNFKQPDNTDEVALRELRFHGRCSLQSETIDPRGMRKSSERMEIHDLRIDQVSGVLHGDGPGWLTSVHQGQDIFKEGQFATAPKGLHFLRVDFQQELAGNLTGRQLEFLGNVRTVYGPVAAWDQVIDVTDPAAFGPQDVVVTSQRLALADMGQTRDRFDDVELEATGNAFVRGQTFTASGQRVSYAKTKDQLVLEGDGRNYATLSYQRTPNAVPALLKARKILFWPETKQSEVSDLHSIDLQNLSQFNRPAR
ncbi:MAG: hypothetical protein O3C40_25950 [Planctomycetota bacterium]|nr:hypothetical protein [Planctomycetota bacterium]